MTDGRSLKTTLENHDPRRLFLSFFLIFSLYFYPDSKQKKEFSRRRPVSIKCRQTHRPYRTEGANVLDDQQTHSLLCLSFLLYQYVCAINPSRLVVVPVWNVSLDRRHCYQWRPSVANNSTTTSRSSVLLVEIFFPLLFASLLIIETAIFLVALCLCLSRSFLFFKERHVCVMVVNEVLCVGRRRRVVVISER